ncbi:MAG: PorP/SprF family type IX secretion system membrane protein [Bacteroidota bacterium]|nr:PorP/SprF family type IX secretion system membrane protein [Bacteroidota bacterium]
MRLKICMLISLSALFLSVSGQSDPQFSLHEFNRLQYNPAATAQSNYINVHLSARQQWLGWDDAPATQSFSISNYFDKLKIGVALTAINDTWGAESVRNIKLKYSYHVWFADDKYLSFGLGTGVVIKTFDGSGLIFEQNPEPHNYTNTKTETRLDFDFGMELHLSDFVLGVASNHITQSYSETELLRVPRHNYAYMSYNIAPTHDFSFLPTIAISHIDKVILPEFRCAFSIKEKITAGIGYRLDEAMILFSKVQITEGISFAYSYDMAAGNLQSYRNGSHEILLEIKIFKPQKYYNSPRFFD